MLCATNRIIGAITKLFFFLDSLVIVLVRKVDFISFFRMYKMKMTGLKRIKKSS